MRLAASSSELPDGFLATLTTAQLNPKPHPGVPSKNPAPHPAFDERNSTAALGLRAGLVLNGLRQSERARYYGSALGRFTSTDPITATPLHAVNPQRWNMYAYAVNNPLAYTDPDGRDAIAVNFTKEVPLGGHEGIISVHADGTAEYARFGPVGGGKPFGAGQVDTLNLNPVQFGSDGLPTDAAYKDLTQQVAGFEHQDPSTVRMNYFKTSEADTLAVDAWIKRLKDASDRKQAPAYDVTRQNCAVFCIAGLIQGNAIQNKNISLVPNTLFQLLSGVATENYSNGQRSPKEQVTSKFCYTDENGKQVCQ